MSTMASISPLSMTFNPTKFPCISNNKKLQFGFFFSVFFSSHCKIYRSYLFEKRESRLKLCYHKCIASRLSWYITPSSKKNFLFLISLSNRLDGKLLLNSIDFIYRCTLHIQQHYSGLSDFFIYVDSTPNFSCHYSEISLHKK